MSRSSKGFADFFPTAPSVLQKKRSKGSSLGEPSSPSVREVTRNKTPTAPSPSKTLEGANPGNPHGVSKDNGKSDLQHVTASDDQYGAHPDLTHEVGSASSTATSDSVFSSNHQSVKVLQPNGVHDSNDVTPLTNLDSSPRTTDAHSPPKTLAHGTQHTDTTSPDALQANLGASKPRTLKPQAPRQTHSQPHQARPGPGEVKGYKILYDPAKDPSGKKKGREPQYEAFGAEVSKPHFQAMRLKTPTHSLTMEQDSGPPPSDPRLSIRNYSKGAANANKRKVRVAPYKLVPYPYDANSTVPPPPIRIVVTGFDPLTPQSQIHHLFSSFGTIEKLINQTDPETGSFLGICLIKYRDTPPIRGAAVKTASTAANEAFLECKNGQHRIGLRSVFAELDRDGTVGKRATLKAIHRLRPKDLASNQAKRKEVVETLGPPPSAPKGPSAKSAIRPRYVPPPPPPTGPASRIPFSAPRSSLPLGSQTRQCLSGGLMGGRTPECMIQQIPVKQQLKNQPYILISKDHVPIMAKTIEHLNGRLRAHEYKEDIKCDGEGYYIIFEASKRGADSCVNCYWSCHMKMLFDYTMNMECYPHGRKDYVRSPSPATKLAEQRKREEIESLQKEQEMNEEEEKKQRAADLDPVTAVVDLISEEMKAKLLEDTKSRIAAQALFDYLAPERHETKRRKLNISDPSDVKKSTMRLNTLDDGSMYNAYSSIFGRRALGATLNATALPRIRKSIGSRRENIGFADERRRQRPPKKTEFRGLHHRLRQFHQDVDDSDEEHRTSLTRDTEEPESRPLSRMSVVSGASEDTFDHSTPRKHRRREESTPASGMDDDEGMQGVLDADNQDLVDAELLALQQQIDGLAPTSRKRKRLEQEFISKRKRKEDDLLFGIVKDESIGAQFDTSPNVADIRLEVEDGTAEVSEPHDDATAGTKADLPKTQKPKAKRKTKKQIAEEQEALDRDDAIARQIQKVSEETRESLEAPAEEVLLEETPGEVSYGITKVEPRRTVEDDDSVVLDLDGWQDLIKDQDDLQNLQSALSTKTSAGLGNSLTWAWKQKEIKAMNRGGERGVVKAETKVEGYYISNPSGCARTEGTQRILESEKSKYLPHRIKVQKAREEREAKAKENPIAAAAEAAKLAAAKSIAKSSSRSTRVNNRRLVQDIEEQRKVLSVSNGGEGDAISFNQLKKRKKPVKFARSAIHNWGLYAMEDIAANDMIIEYVGEKVRQQVADIRERQYLKSGIGSSYLFRIDENTVIDATKKGGIARFINHSCTPNCTAKIIRVEGSKRIVIYALRDIGQSEFSQLIDTGRRRKY